MSEPDKRLGIQKSPREEKLAFACIIANVILLAFVCALAFQLYAARTNTGQPELTVDDGVTETGWPFVYSETGGFGGSINDFSRTALGLDLLVDVAIPGMLLFGACRAAKSLRYVGRSKARGLVLAGCLLLALYVPLAELWFHAIPVVGRVLADTVIGVGALLCFIGPFFTARPLWWKVAVGLGMVFASCCPAMIGADCFHMLLGWG